MADIQNQGTKSMNNDRDRQKLLQLNETIKTANAFIQTNLDKRIISWNEVAEKVYGYSASEVIGQDLFSLLLPEEPRTMQKLLSNEQLEAIDPYQQIHRRKDRKRIHVRMSMALIKNGKGDVTGYSILVREVTERSLGAPIPENEAERLADLYKYQILDTPPEEIFDDFTKLASYIFKTPIALITLIDAERQWFKSKVGLNISEISRDVAFDGYAILQEDVLIVEDALADERFANNPLVTGEPKIRFYAGSPLITSSGFAVGTVCVIDKIPKKLSREQVEMLQILSRQIVRQLELRKKPENFDALKKETDELKSLLSEYEKMVNAKLVAVNFARLGALKQANTLKTENLKLSDYAAQPERLDELLQGYNLLVSVNERLIVDKTRLFDELKAARITLAENLGAISKLQAELKQAKEQYLDIEDVFGRGIYGLQE